MYNFRLAIIKNILRGNVGARSNAEISGLMKQNGGKHEAASRSSRGENIVEATLLHGRIPAEPPN